MAEKVARLNAEQWGAFEAALDGEIADLRDRLQQAQEELAAAKRAGITASGKLLEAVVVGEELARDYDKAIERGKRLWLLASLHIGDHHWWVKTCDYWQQQAETARADRAMNAARDVFWRLVSDLDARAEAAEALVEDLVKALTQVRDEMVTCTEWREDDPLYRIADDTLAHVEALEQRKGAP